MKHCIALVATAILSSMCIVAQSSSDQQRVGLFGNYTYDMHSASFGAIPGVPNCCPEFTGGTGSGIFGGLTYLSPIETNLFMDIRLHYGGFSGTMTSRQSLPIITAGGAQTTAEIEHSLTSSFAQIGAEPLIGYRITPEFALRAGILAAYRISSTFEQKETMLQPANATFETGRRTRNETGGDLPFVSSVGLSFTVGASYDLPLNANRTMFISPEVYYTFAPFSIVDNISWTISHLRAGLSVSLIPPSAVDSLDAFQLFDVARRTPLPIRGQTNVSFIPSVTAVGVAEDGTRTGEQAIKIEQFASTRIRPLLPYVFFDEKSLTIPDRYSPLNSEQVDRYSLDNFYNLDAMVTYYQVLNIVGKRMQEKPSATLTLTGFAGADELMPEATQLSQGGARAESIRSYLVSTWGIDPSRITIERREAPSNPSSTTDAEGRAENRRVELASSDASILAPVVSSDTMRVFSPAGVRFTPSIDPQVPIASWTVFISEDERLIKTFHGETALPPSVDWRVAEQEMYIPVGARTIEYMLVARDTTGRVVPSEMKVLPVNEVTIDQKQRSGSQDKTIDRYSLILFGFDKAELTSEHRSLIEAVRGRITPGSQVRIVGYTDMVGSEEYNQRLSQQRASAVAQELRVPNATVVGNGERLPLYDNQRPEGRFYNRTVEIIVEAPRK
jgi:outer membrane protein OmpA-like peptidoglycan-associated protein